MVIVQVADINPSGVIRPDFLMDAVHITHYSFYIRCVFVMRAVEEVGASIAEDDLVRCLHKEVKQVGADIRIEDDEAVHFLGLRNRGVGDH